MTITYTGEVPNGSTFGCFWSILRKWRGSVYKLVWRELLAYLFLYYSINLAYRFALNDEQKRIFEKIRLYFSQQSETIPMSFVMGFYVSLVVKRWWEQYKLLPWPDTLALFLNAAIPGADERQRLMRRTIVRFAVLSYVITLQRVSLRVKKRFPTWQHVVDSGLMLENERVIFERMDAKTPMSKYWMPLVWATNIINRARKESLITSDQIVQTLLTELSVIRQKLGSLIGYDTVCVPLVYTQVVTLALYTYFIAALMGRQFIPDAPQPVGKFEDPDMYFPFFTALQFCFYVGWLKVAEVLINPFGEDDDDIELNWLIDRHIKASYMIVDEMHEEHPELLKDQFWDDVVPTDLPYTVASEHCRREEPKGSAEKYKVKTADALYANLQVPSRKIIIDDMYADYESVDTPIVQRRKSPSWINRISISRPRGSVRSASTAYSSGGLFSRHRGNSVYAETAGQLPHQQQPKMSIYDRLVRRSGRNKNHTKTVKSRPRIPTPDVTKEVVDRENRLAQNAVHMQNQISPNVTLMAHQLQGACPNDVPMVQVVLSPIQELDGSGSVNNTLHAGQPGTAALAQAVLSPGLGPVLTKPITVSQLTSLGLAKVTSSPLLTKAVAINSSPLFARAVADTSQPSTLIEYTPEGLVKVTKSPLLQGADSLHDSPSSGKALTDDGYTSDGLTKVTNSPLFTGVDQSCMLAEYTSDDEMKQNISSRSSNASNHTNASNDTKEATDTTASLTSNGIGIESERKISMNTPSTLSSPHLEFLSSPSDNASRKTSVASQSSSPKREVYV